MTLDDVQARYESLKQDAGTMPPSEKTLGIFEAVSMGNALSAYVQLASDPDLHIKQDKSGMTPLHHASSDHSGLMIRVLVVEPNIAPIIRDKYDRTPLDVAIENDNQIGQEILFPITFARQFIQQEMHEHISDPQWLIDKLESYAQRYEHERLIIHNTQSKSPSFDLDKD